jgi:hypothetical protein
METVAEFGPVPLRVTSPFTASGKMSNSFGVLGLAVNKRDGELHVAKVFPGVWQPNEWTLSFSLPPGAYAVLFMSRREVIRIEINVGFCLTSFSPVTYPPPQPDGMEKKSAKGAGRVVDVALPPGGKFVKIPVPKAQEPKDIYIDTPFDGRRTPHVPQTFTASGSVDSPSVPVSGYVGGVSKSGSADAEGNWALEFSNVDPGEHVLTVEGDNGSDDVTVIVDPGRQM